MHGKDEIEVPGLIQRVSTDNQSCSACTGTRKDGDIAGDLASEHCGRLHRCNEVSSTRARSGFTDHVMEVVRVSIVPARYGVA
jgi:hypothetical protein